MTLPSFAGPADTAVPARPVESPLLARRFPAYPTRFTFEPSSRWVRGVVGETAVVDSRHQLLIWEPGAKVPEYAFPQEHVRVDLLEPAPGRPERTRAFWRPRSDHVQWFDLTVGDRRIPGAGWRWNVPGLEGYLSLSWYPDVLDAWYEEDEHVITHPRDPANRVDVIASSRHVEVRYRDRRLADSHAPLLLFENGLPTRFYLPEADVDLAALEPLELSTTCPYKGEADRYWRAAGGREEIAWSYSAPFPQVAGIAGRIAFYNERVELVVDGAPFRDARSGWA
ncbi:MAG: DUF427 domain-containing protein [Microbacterium sp.]|uniref:DUF427 domain-containing protein n=1 Tax=Microbacterium sp. TaxID=51671 RepID=UPI0039E6EB6D